MVYYIMVYQLLYIIMEDRKSHDMWKAPLPGRLSPARRQISFPPRVAKGRRQAAWRSKRPTSERIGAVPRKFHQKLNKSDEY